MTTYVALLRAINLGPKNKVPMAELTKIFAAARCSDVRTYIQSGNVVFCASPTIASTLFLQIRQWTRAGRSSKTDPQAV